MAGQFNSRHGEIRASASATLNGNASTMPSTDRISVQAMPPSGPLGYCPISSSSQLSRRMSKTSLSMAYLAVATRLRRLSQAPAAMISSEIARYSTVASR